jgi:glucose-6-phosphate isomerase
MAEHLSSVAEWKELETHYKEAKEWHMRDMFTDDPGRFGKFSLSLTGQDGGILLDYSKNIVSEKTMQLLFKLV